MKQYIKVDPWRIIEEGFNSKYNRISESLCALGNGRMGQRANFEEHYSGDSLQGSYVAGVYYPDKTRVGWWKNGYPEYFAKVLNSPNWIGINVEIVGEELDLAKCEIRDFRRVLDMKEGCLHREFIAVLPSGREINVEALRFLSLVDDEIGCIRYAITPLNFSGQIEFIPYIDADVQNEDSNYNEKFWEEQARGVIDGGGYIVTKTKKLDFHVATGMRYDIKLNDKPVQFIPDVISKFKFVANRARVNVDENQTVTMYKYGAVLSSQNHAGDHLIPTFKHVLSKAFDKGFDVMFAEHKSAWAAKWAESDIVIEGDEAAQQGIRFNIFQLNQTYTGEDARLNIGPKGFTGEKYGGSTYWDTESICLPFYLSTAEQRVARQLLMYRYRHLPRAIENAQKLGFSKGAALYPMVTMNGEECHNEWEITFEEIHRNGTIAHAIYNYVHYTGDEEYLVNYGLEVLIGICRFWKQRANWSNARAKYVILGVTGPNEYENNVNNNWYTNYIAAWCLRYVQEALITVKKLNETKLNALLDKIDFEDEELTVWQDIANKMYYPENKELQVFMQQDGYMDKEQILVKDLPDEEQPICQKWSWDRILRSCFIKQADVLQGLYYFENEFDEDVIRRNFEFYEPRTVHESSLSPCVHSILAAKLGMREKAYEMYLRTSRLDLDDYNNDTCDGCHITSMGGTWMSVVQGFGGMRVKEGKLHFAPFIPEQWQAFAFKVNFRGNLLKITVNKDKVTIENKSDKAINLALFNKDYNIVAHDSLVVDN